MNAEIKPMNPLTTIKSITNKGDLKPVKRRIPAAAVETVIPSKMSPNRPILSFSL